MKTEIKKLERKFGLIGKNISYSFSETYFKNKFSIEGIDDAVYSNYDISSIEEFNKLAEDASILGLNVTIPYKEDVIQLLDQLNATAGQIGAVNTIKRLSNGKLKGYNTDYYGFEKSLIPHLKKHHTKALILGTGGASKAIAYALDRLSINYKFVSRVSKQNCITYQEVTPQVLTNHTLIINCTPLGTSPNVCASPNIPYNSITKNHILFDLIYNPKETLFLKKGKENGATIVNGENMLKYQAEKAWEIWNR